MLPLFRVEVKCCSTNRLLKNTTVSPQNIGTSGGCQSVFRQQNIHQDVVIPKAIVHLVIYYLVLTLYFNNNNNDIIFFSDNVLLFSVCTFIHVVPSALSKSATTITALKTHSDDSLPTKSLLA